MKKVMKIQYRKQNEKETAPWQQLNTLDEIVWNGRYDIRVKNHNISMSLPFTLGVNDTATLVVKDYSHIGRLQHSRTIVQTMSKVEQEDGKVLTYSRTYYKTDGKHKWSEWRQSANAAGEAGNENAIIWNSCSHIDTYTTAGVYSITGERTNAADGLPIANAAPGHTFHARLVVLDSSIASNGQSDDKCITQMLMLSNRTGGDGDVYVRTGHASNKNLLAGGNGWEMWGKMQQNVQVGVVPSLDNFTDNGIYSGIYISGNSVYETFVMVVINNYVAATATGKTRCISQFKYALNTDSNFGYKTRTGRGEDEMDWGSWVDLGAASTTDIQDNSITAQKLSRDVRTKVENPLRPLYIAAGAEYNDSGADKTKTAPWGETVTHKAGHYYLNGLGDITEEQMMDIYNSDKYWLCSECTGVMSGVKARTNKPPYSNILYKYKEFSFHQAFNETNIEVLFLTSNKSHNDCILVTRLSYLGQGSKNLKRVVGVIDVSKLTQNTDTKINPPSLTHINIIKISRNFSFYLSPNLSKESIVYMITNATPTSAITITLHPDAYARLADDAEIVAALEAQPLISLVSA